MKTTIIRFAHIALLAVAAGPALAATDASLQREAPTMLPQAIVAADGGFAISTTTPGQEAKPIQSRSDIQLGSHVHFGHRPVTRRYRLTKEEVSHEQN